MGVWVMVQGRRHDCMGADGNWRSIGEAVGLAVARGRLSTAGIKASVRRREM